MRFIDIFQVSPIFMLNGYFIFIGGHNSVSLSVCVTFNPQRMVMLFLVNTRWQHTHEIIQEGASAEYMMAAHT